MNRRQILALGGATIALAVSPAVAAGRTRVTVRVEGSTKTLLASHTVQTPAGSITQDGAPSGACPAASAAGALDAATGHDWKGKFYASYGDYLISSILGDTPDTKTGYWGIWVDNRYATTGACQLALKSGDQVLFAVDSINHHQHPLGISGPASATRGRTFKVKVVTYSDAGRARPIAGAHVTGAGRTAVTNRQGITSITAATAGRLHLSASDDGHIRSAVLGVTVAA